MNIPRWMLSAQLREEQRRSMINTDSVDPEEDVTRAQRWAAVIGLLCFVGIVMANQVLRG